MLVGKLLRSRSGTVIQPIARVVLMNATHGKGKEPNTTGHKYCASPPGGNPEQARPQNQKKIHRGLGARDRVLLPIGNMSSGLGQTTF